MQERRFQQLKPQDVINLFHRGRESFQEGLTKHQGFRNFILNPWTISGALAFGGLVIFSGEVSLRMAYEIHRDVGTIKAINPFLDALGVVAGGVTGHYMGYLWGEAEEYRNKASSIVSGSAKSGYFAIKKRFGLKDAGSEYGKPVLIKQKRS